ncbi:MAG TPA: hypothetical protein VHX38_10865 [Pseudonocardiaceae bacterium]|jgi:hypothetical protein|nr:hypothetical protein [Pseudonocardiaceae bacterium]
MWSVRFNQHLADRLATRPEIASGELASVAGDGAQLPDLIVTTTDGTKFHLRVVRSSPGSEDHSQPENIVTKNGLTRAGS